jgi:hypothetical protein
MISIQGVLGICGRLQPDLLKSQFEFSPLDVEHSAADPSNQLDEAASQPVNVAFLLRESSGLLPKQEPESAASL